jgi:glutathione S-transferase
MKLLGSPGSPFVRKARAFAAEKAIAIEYVIDRPNAPGSTVRSLNPLGKIPLLLLDSGEAIYDSAVIVEYLDGTKPEPQLIPSELNARINVKRWEALGDGLADAIIMISHDWGPMSDASKRGEWIERQYGKIERSIAAIDHAIRGREWLHGDSLTLADVCAAYPLLYADTELPKLDWRGRHPAAAGFAERMAQRPSFRSTVPAK